MRKKQQTPFDVSPAWEDAFDRTCTLARSMAAELAGCQEDEPRTHALVAAMLYFLLKIPQADLDAMFLGEGSFEQVPFHPWQPGKCEPGLLAGLLSYQS